METPAPYPNDSEDVVTALETAAIFAAKGDAIEAGHWVGRAAECATQSGNAVRASELERAAAMLSQDSRRCRGCPRASVAHAAADARLGAASATLGAEPESGIERIATDAPRSSLVELHTGSLEDERATVGGASKPSERNEHATRPTVERAPRQRFEHATDVGGCSLTESDSGSCCSRPS